MLSVAMSKNSIEKTVTLVVHARTFRELELLARKQKSSLSDLYYKAVQKYLDERSPSRKTVYAAPKSGKRIRVIFDEKLHDQLTDKILDVGFSPKDVVYTALEYFLENSSVSTAA